VLTAGLLVLRLVPGPDSWRRTAPRSCWAGSTVPALAGFGATLERPRRAARAGPGPSPPPAPSSSAAALLRRGGACSRPVAALFLAGNLLVAILTAQPGQGLLEPRRAATSSRWRCSGGLVALSLGRPRLPHRSTARSGCRCPSRPRGSPSSSSSCWASSPAAASGLASRPRRRHARPSAEAARGSARAAGPRLAEQKGPHTRHRLVCGPADDSWGVVTAIPLSLYRCWSNLSPACLRASTGLRARHDASGPGYSTSAAREVGRRLAPADEPRRPVAHHHDRGTGHPRL